MKHRMVALGSALLLAVGLAPAANASPDRPEVSVAIRHDISPPLRELALIPRKAVAQPNRVIDNKVPLDLAQRAKPNPGGPDPVLQADDSIGETATPAPTLSFEGM